MEIIRYVNKDSEWNTIFLNEGIIYLLDEIYIF